MVDLPVAEWTRHLLSGGRLADEEASRLAQCSDLAALTAASAAIRDQAYGDIVTVSRKVFIPLTKLCRDVCHYCTFAHPPVRNQRSFLQPGEVLKIAIAGASAGCDEALFTLGDKPELRYRAARDELASLGYATTLEYLEAMARLVLEETGLLPHINAGVMSEAELEMLRGVSVSQGLMLETASPRLSERGGPHFGSPDKMPAPRLEMIAAAGRLHVPFTTGILIGIGETRQERVEALLALRQIHERYGHIQEIIVQNFRAKPGTRMANAPEPSLDEQLWTIAVARLILGREITIQSPPNLRDEDLAALVSAGINDWGGMSPVTPDHVNPEAPWPQMERLAQETAAAGKVLAPRLAIYPAWLHAGTRWIDGKVLPYVLRRADGQGLAQESGWRIGRHLGERPFPFSPVAIRKTSPVSAAIDEAVKGLGLSEEAIVHLFEARGSAAAAVREAAASLAHQKFGDAVTYVVNRNINYTNICTYKCAFCAFSKGRTAEHLRGRPYNIDHVEIARRTREAWQRGGTEVCMQGGIHPDYSGNTYLSILRAAKDAVASIHVHAFSPLEVSQGAETLGLSVETYLRMLKDAGLGSLPGTAAEILDDEVRSHLCPDKLSTEKWLSIIETAHRIGLRTTATIMYGHIDRYEHWARHLLRIRSLQEKTNGFTEFVPLPFVHMEAPMYLKGRSRQGPSLREAIAMHAVARLVLNGAIDSIQASWVKLGQEGIAAVLAAGVNDLGGTLMNESISRAAGSEFGQELPPQQMESLIHANGRQPRQRTTLYGSPPETQVERSFNPAQLAAVVQTPVGQRDRRHAGQTALR